MLSRMRGAGEMQHALVVHSNGASCWAIQRLLERRGFRVEMCLGPTHSVCELAKRRPCPKVERSAGESSIAYLGGLPLSTPGFEELVREYTRRFSRVVVVGPHPSEVERLRAMGVEVLTQPVLARAIARSAHPSHQRTAAVS